MKLLVRRLMSSLRPWTQAVPKLQLQRSRLSSQRRLRKKRRRKMTDLTK